MPLQAETISLFLRRDEECLSALESLPSSSASLCFTCIFYCSSILFELVWVPLILTLHISQLIRTSTSRFLGLLVIILANEVFQLSLFHLNWLSMSYSTFTTMLTFSICSRPHLRGTFLCTSKFFRSSRTSSSDLLPSSSYPPSFRHRALSKCHSDLFLYPGMNLSSQL